MGGFQVFLVDRSSRDRNRWAWSHVISLCKERLVTGQIVPRLEANEIMSINRLVSNSMAEVRRT